MNLRLLVCPLKIYQTVPVVVVVVVVFFLLPGVPVNNLTMKLAKVTMDVSICRKSCPF